MAKYWTGTLRPDENSTMTKSSNYVEAGTVVTVTANDGYVLDTIYLETNDGNTHTITESVGLTTYAFEPRKILPDAFNTSKVTITSATKEVEVGQTVSYSETLGEGITSNFTKEVIEQSDVISLSADDYYKFTEVTVSLNGTPSTYTPEDNAIYFPNDATEFSMRMETRWTEDLESVSIDAKAESYTEYTETVENAVSNMQLSTIDVNSIINITSIEKYDFNNGLTITYKRAGVDETITYNPKNYARYFDEYGTEFNLPLSDVWSDDLQHVTVQAVAEETPPPADVYYTETLQYVTSNIDTQATDTPNYYTGRILENETLILTTDEGYEFQDSIEVSYTRRQNTGFVKTFYPNSASDSVYFNEENTIFSLNVNEFWEWDTNIIGVIASAKESYQGGDDDNIEDSTTNFANVYYADSGILSSITAERFSKSQTGGTDGQGDLPIDMGSYIYQVYKYPLKLNEDSISQTSIKMQMGYHDLETESRYMLRSRLRFDLGTIMVPEIYNNIYDYRDTQCLLHVPYAEPIEIDTTYIVGQMVELSYFLDLYNGTTTLEVYSDKIQGGLVHRESDVPVAFDIPFIQPTYNGVSNRVGGFINNKVTTPYIEVVRNIPYDQSTVFGKEGKEYGKLDKFRGYVEVADLDLSSIATRTEQEEIESLLSDGVVINKTQSDIPVEST